MKRALAGLLLVGVLSTCATASADEPVRETRYDADEYPPSWASTRLMLVGASITGAWYLGGLSMSFLFPDAPGADDLRIPVAGPWMALADTGCSDEDPDCSTFTVVLRAILTVMDGVGQVGGLGILAEGAFLPTSSGKPKPKRRARSSSIYASPWATDRGAGLQLLGRF